MIPVAPRFVIVGTGRSGSKYIAHALTKAGIPCGAEWWFNAHNINRNDMVGDSSCCALPLGLADYKGTIYHQIRHPLDVITSMVRAPVTEPHLSLFARLLPDTADLADMLDFGMHVWLQFALTADRLTQHWWRLDQISPELLVMIGGNAGITVDRDAAAAALAAVPTTTNRHYGQRGHRITWQQLHRHNKPLADQIRGYSHAYGFTD